MTDLKSQIVGKKPAWSYTYVALDVNDDGVVVGSGRVKVGKTSQEHGFLARQVVAALNAAGVGARSTATLCAAEAEPLVSAAVRCWAWAGADTSALHGIDLRIADLGGTTLGLASGSTIWLDDNAAGSGWFVDPTPWEDSEFSRLGNQGEQLRMDLLTVLEHEVGHLLGKEHEGGGVMQETLTFGSRQSPFARSYANSLRAVDQFLSIDLFSSKKRRLGW